MDTKINPVALITGAGRGIGRAIALELARTGYDCVINYRGDKKSAAETRQGVMDAGRRGELCQGDIALAADRERMLEFTRQTYGRVNLLVNNAGVAPLQRVDLLEASEESYDRVMTTNLKGPYFLTQAVARWMIELRQADPQQLCRIVNISSISAYTSSPTRGEYCMSKAGVGMMTRLFADRLADHGIGVYEIRPGVIKTDMTKAVQEKYDKLIAEGLTPIKRWGTPQDVARAVVAVASGNFDFSTGLTLDVDGGFHLRRL